MAASMFAAVSEVIRICTAPSLNVFPVGMAARLYAVDLLATKIRTSARQPGGR
jgi:hypothetical protein